MTVTRQLNDSLDSPDGIHQALPGHLTPFWLSHCDFVTRSQGAPTLEALRACRILSLERYDIDGLVALLAACRPNHASHRRYVAIVVAARDDDVLVAADEKVARGDVAMEDAVPVQVTHTLRHFQRPLQQSSRGQTSLMLLMIDE